MEIKNHVLQGDSISQKRSPNISGKFAKGDLDTVIIHFTAGASAQSSVDFLCKPSAKASAHLVVGRDGSVIQLVPFDTVAWHAGKSTYGDRTGFNKYSIGIEIDNPGLLTKSGDTYKTWFGRNVIPEDVIEAIHRNQFEPTYWHAFTEEQIILIEQICRLLVEEYNINLILGHEEISPKRKVDPGPAFPLDKMRERIFDGNRDEEGGEDEIYAYYSKDGEIPYGKKLQQFLNGFPEIALKVDGWPGKKSSDAFKKVTGHYLKGDPRN